MQPLTVFDVHFRSAQVLLKVYRLLDAGSTPSDGMAFLPALKTAVQCADDEQVVPLLNDLFVGLVRERAEVQATFFKRTNLALLLREAVVSACTAMDVFFPALLEEHLPHVVRVKQRNFLPQESSVRDLFRDFHLRLEELPALLEAGDPEERWAILTRRVLDYCQQKTLSNVSGITAAMMMLGLGAPWKEIATTAGMAEQSLRSQIQTVVKRRNDIVHRGDRPVGQPDEPQPIDYAWAHSHVNAIQSVVLACDALASSATDKLLSGVGVA